MKGIGIGIALIALGSSQALAVQKISAPKGWAEVACHAPAVSLYLPGGWRWSDLTTTGGASFGSSVMLIQAWVPKKNSPQDRLAVIATPATGAPVGEENLNTFVAGLQHVMPAAKLIKQAVVDVAGEKGYMVHVQLPTQGDDTEKPRMVDQYIYLVPGKKYDYHVTYTFNAGGPGGDELQQKSIATFTMKD